MTTKEELVRAFIKVTVRTAMIDVARAYFEDKHEEMREDAAYCQLKKQINESTETVQEFADQVSEILGLEATEEEIDEMVMEEVIKIAVNALQR